MRGTLFLAAITPTHTHTHTHTHTVAAGPARPRPGTSLERRRALEANASLLIERTSSMCNMALCRFRWGRVLTLFAACGMVRQPRHVGSQRVTRLATKRVFKGGNMSSSQYIRLLFAKAFQPCAGSVLPIAQFYDARPAGNHSGLSPSTSKTEPPPLL